QNMLGLKIQDGEVRRILLFLGFKLKKVFKRGKVFFLVQIPTWRQDVKLPADLVEEIARLKGLDQIPAESPGVKLEVSMLPQRSRYVSKARHFLKSAGFNEVYHYSFINQKSVDLLGGEELVELENPLSSEQQYLRPSLVSRLLTNAALNSKFYSSFKLFEIGHIFKYQPPKGLEERLSLAFLIFEKQDQRTDLFYSLKGVAEALLKEFGIWPVTFKSKSVLGWKNGQSFAIIKQGRETGLMGGFLAALLKNIGIKGSLYACELDFEWLLEQARADKHYHPFSLYPAILRDIAVLVPRFVPAGKVERAIKKAGSRLLKSIELFDVFEGKPLPVGFKNLAFHLTYQAQNRTLSSAEVNLAHQKITTALQNRSGWRVR
ncbi:MAG: hypothetical protein ACK4NX_03010, partial [Candidatus Paceibacteria bacterium]